MINSKQRAYLRAMANTYEPILQIGKGGLTPAVEASVSEALEARELIKVRVLKNNDQDVKELAAALAASVSADLVQTMGRNFILYRQNSEKPVIELPK